MTYGNNIDEKFSQWKGKAESHAKTKKLAAIVGSVTAFGWLLFIYKMGQTSEMALRYSNEAHESIGTWILVLLAMSIASVVLIALSGSAKKRATALATNMVPQLRAQLNDADAGQRSKLESQLRELGA